MNTPKHGLDGFQLKIFALIVMTIDHIHYFMPESVGIPYWFTLIGRLAAPIFLFLCVEGFSYTHSKPKYLLRMYCFSVAMKLASRQLNLAFPRPDNVAIINDMFSTMFVVCWCIEGIELLRNREKGLPRWLGALLLGIMLAASTAPILMMHFSEQVPLPLLWAVLLLLPNPISCEGGILWVLLAIAMFYTRKSRLKTIALMAAFFLLGFGLMPITLENVLYFACIFASVVPICLYNGTPGKHRCKWLFYGYYPAHAYALYLIGWWICTHTNI